LATHDELPDAFDRHSKDFGRVGQGQ
jgi:hypothetical protein